MTRWARNSNRQRSSEATPWSHLRSGGAGDSAAGGQSHRSQNSKPAPSKKRVQKQQQADVNGFLEYLEQTKQALPRARQEPSRAPHRDDEVLKKFKRREARRLKRQNTKKSNMVCFVCRKPGHGVADCPQAADDEEMGQGICYRCGSTEHDLRMCRAKVDPAVGDYPYAKCFICGKTGHLSRSCADNPKGLYAAGGCCRVCGSVEHFQKDCPEHQSSTNTLTVSRLCNRISADHEDVHVPVKAVPPKKSNIVVF